MKGVSYADQFCKLDLTDTSDTVSHGN